jgi:hypothetical protein
LNYLWKNADVPWFVDGFLCISSAWFRYGSTEKTWYNRYNHHKSSIQWAIANSDVKIAHLPGGLRDHGSGCAARSDSLPGGGGCLVWSMARKWRLRTIAKLVNRLPRAECLWDVYETSIQGVTMAIIILICSIGDVKTQSTGMQLLHDVWIWKGIGMNQATRSEMTHHCQCWNNNNRIWYLQ